jgi:hypothetical protein
MDTLGYIGRKCNLDLNAKSPIDIPDFSRWDNLPVLFRELGFRVGAEIGVEQGVYSERLCKLIPGLRLYSVDAWTAYGGYRDHVSQEKLDGFYANTVERLALYNCDVIKSFSVPASELFADGSLDFVYIDGNHDFVNATQDIHYWSPKVRKGGIVAGHDFRRVKNCHVVDVVTGWTKAYGIEPWFVIRGDKSSSWFWVKA